jgi:hypothetical protein
MTKGHLRGAHGVDRRWTRRQIRSRTGEQRFSAPSLLGFFSLLHLHNIESNHSRKISAKQIIIIIIIIIRQRSICVSILLGDDVVDHAHRKAKLDRFANLRNTQKLLLTNDMNECTSKSTINAYHICQSTERRLENTQFLSIATVERDFYQTNVLSS